MPTLRPALERFIDNRFLLGFLSKQILLSWKNDRELSRPFSLKEQPKFIQSLLFTIYWGLHTLTLNFFKYFFSVWNQAFKKNILNPVIWSDAGDKPQLSQILSYELWTYCSLQKESNCPLLRLMTEKTFTLQIENSDWS